MVDFVSKYFVYLFPVLTVALIIYYFVQYRRHTYDPGTVYEMIKAEPRPFFSRVNPLDRGDIAPLLILTLVYGAVAFFNLGSPTNPQTFHRFTSESPSVIIDIGKRPACPRSRIIPAISMPGAVMPSRPRPTGPSGSSTPT